MTPTPPLSIFVVENDDDTRRFFALWLERKGHTVETAGSLRDAVDQLSRRAYDVLIADIGLPDGSGWELHERLRAAGIPAPPYAIAMSGFGRSDDRKKSEEAGYRHHLVKPLDTARLDAILDEAAGARQVSRS
jgi:CheY-like chemotaxis protein